MWVPREADKDPPLCINNTLVQEPPYVIKVDGRVISFSNYNSINPKKNKKNIRKKERAAWRWEGAAWRNETRAWRRAMLKTPRPNTDMGWPDSETNYKFVVHPREEIPVIS